MDEKLSKKHIDLGAMEAYEAAVLLFAPDLHKDQYKKDEHLRAVAHLARKAYEPMFPTVESLQDIVLKYTDTHAAYCFARDIPGADIQALQDMVVKEKSCKSAYLFARDVKGADINILQNMIIDIGKDLDIIDFAEDVVGANTAVLQSEIMRRGDPASLYRFARYAQGADIHALREKLVALTDQAKENADEALQWFDKSQKIADKLAQQNMDIAVRNARKRPA